MNKAVLYQLCVGAGLLTLGNSHAWANSPPVVTNITVVQRTDSSMLVDIGYDLADADGDACTVTVIVSDDGGGTWDVPAVSLTGDIGAGMTPGTAKHITWNSAADLPGAYGANYKLRVCADDGRAPGGEMVVVPGGEFEMGDSFGEGSGNELPVHTVYLNPYFIDKYEVTNQQYANALNWAWGQGGLIYVDRGVVRKVGGITRPYCDTTTVSSYSRITWDGSTFGVTAGKEDDPMVMVSWYGAAAFCNWRSAMEGQPLCYELYTWRCNFAVAGYRLPTEAEWEKAAAWDPVQQRHFRFGEHTDGCGHTCLDGQRANYVSSGDPFESGWSPKTTPVGYYNGTMHGSYTTQNAQSYYGCYDMAGNAWEWCNDWHDSSYYSTPEATQPNPHGPAIGGARILRGGGWDTDLDRCRSAFRRGSNASNRVNYRGLRCALGIH